MQNPANYSKYIHTLALIHVALLIVQLFFIGITIILKGANGYLNIFATSESFYFPVIICTAIGVFIGNFIYKLRCGVLNESHTLDFKLSLYKSATIIKLFFFEASSLFAIIAFYNSGNFFYLAFSIFIIFLSISHKPSKEKLLNKVNWTNKEKQKLKALIHT